MCVAQGKTRSRKGGVLVLASLFFVLFAAMGALAVDLGWVYLVEARVGRAASAAAAAAADRILDGGNAAQARASAKRFAAENRFPIQDADVRPDPNGNNHNLVEVRVSSTIPLFFAPALGVPSLACGYQVWSQATAETTVLYSGPAGSKAPSGLVPLFIAHADLQAVLAGASMSKSDLANRIFSGAQQFAVGSRYPLKVGNKFSDRLKNITGKSSSGHEGILELPPIAGGQMDYQRTLELGYGAGVAVGEVFDSRVGVISGPTKSAVDARFAQDPAATEATAKAFSARMVVVPIVAAVSNEPDDLGSGVAGLRHLPYAHTGKVSVRVIGHGRFFLDPSDDANGQGVVTGVFSGYVGTPPAGQTGT
jgi:hypothetical protein